jgi:hypothetical protein
MVCAVTTGPQPILPDFDGACLTNVVPALLAHVGAAAALPSWMPAPVAASRQVVLLVLDGLGWEQLTDRSGLAPTLRSGAGEPITSVAPSTTATALTSLTTGLPPAVHGVVGYRVRVDGAVLNMLRWTLDGTDARRTVRPREFQPFEPFPGAGPVPVVTKAEFGATGFTAAHLGASVHHGWSTPSGIVPEVRSLLEAGAPFVYAYYDGIDRVAHARGLSAHYDAELVMVDRLVADLIGELGPTTSLVVTADHGQVDVGPAVEVLGPEITDGVALISGEGRFRWLHVRAGATDDVAAAAASAYGDVAWVLTRQQMVEEGWLGGEPVPAVMTRLGDVALVPFAPLAFLDPADTLEQALAARHGSLTAAEMLVPLVAWNGAD